jgi:hypothetical protein
MPTASGSTFSRSTPERSPTTLAGMNTGCDGKRNGNQPDPGQPSAVQGLRQPHIVDAGRARIRPGDLSPAPPTPPAPSVPVPDYNRAAVRLRLWGNKSVQGSLVSKNHCLRCQFSQPTTVWHRADLPPLDTTAPVHPPSARAEAAPRRNQQTWVQPRAAACVVAAPVTDQQRPNITAALPPAAASMARPKVTAYVEKPPDVLHVKT